MTDTDVVTIPTRWIRLERVHARSETCAAGCVVHNPTAHHMRWWPLLWRDDRGIFERICPEHGVGHPDPDQFPYWRATDRMWEAVHGCCGCCRIDVPGVQGTPDLL